MSVQQILAAALLASVAGATSAVGVTPSLRLPDNAQFRAQQALAQHRAQQNLARQPTAVREQILLNKALAQARMQLNLERHQGSRRQH